MNNTYINLNINGIDATITGRSESGIVTDVNLVNAPASFDEEAKELVMFAFIDGGVSEATLVLCVDDEGDMEWTWKQYAIDEDIVDTFYIVAK